MIITKLKIISWIERKKTKIKRISKHKKHLKEKKEEWECFSNGINEVLGGVLFGY